MLVIYTHFCSFQGILHLRGRPAVAYDQQGLVFAVAMEGGAIKLFDSRYFEKVCASKVHLFALQIMNFFSCVVICRGLLKPS